MKKFVSSQFGYCHFAWMFHSRTLNNKINWIHERAFRMVYRNKTSSFTELLERENKMIMDQKNLQVPAIEFYKVKVGR